MQYMGAYPGVGACPGHYGNSDSNMFHTLFTCTFILQSILVVMAHTISSTEDVSDNSTRLTEVHVNGCGATCTSNTRKRQK